MNKAEKSWILYDVANSAFVLIMITAVMPVFFKEYASYGLEPSKSTSLWGYSNSAAALIVALSAPLLGTMADYRGRKKKFFSLFLFCGLVSALTIITVGRGEWLMCMILFIAARIFWSGANLFYDSFITDITSDDRMDLISSRGYAWGYAGSVLPFLAVIALILYGENSESRFDYFKAGFAVTVLWWGILSIPMLINVRQKKFLPSPNKIFSESISRLRKNLGSAGKNRNIYLFLVAYFLYIDGVDTIISMAAAYGIDSGLGTGTLIGAILMIQLLAFPCALLYGRLAGKAGTKNMISAGIAVYTVITLISFFLPVIESPESKACVFWLLSVLVATSMGGIQALSRSLYGRLIPPERSAEFFGLYNIFGKFAAILGPFMMALTTDITGHSRYGILSILLLFLAGGAVLRKVNPERTEN